MLRKFTKSLLLGAFAVGMGILAACQPTPEPTTAPEATQPPAETKLAVGIVLPTKDEPRWVQDEA